MPRLRTSLRLAAALLAWVGMLALPLRTLAACPMIQSEDGAVMVHHAMTDADEHAGHDMTGVQGTTPEAPVSPEAPGHATCPDLAHCAVAAVPTPLAHAADPEVPVVALRVAAQTAPLSVAITLEPPPPKA